MRGFLASFFHRLGRWLAPGKSTALAASSGASFLDSFRRVREPSASELLAELKNTAWTCATLNASVCASHPPRLYVRTLPGQDHPKCATRPLPVDHPLRIEHKGMRVEEVLDHPLLSLLQQVNPVHNAHDLWELTTLYQEVHGVAYWLIDVDALAMPVNIWPLPGQYVRPVREAGSRNIVDYYEYCQGRTSERLAPERVIAFRYPNPRDPYLSGLSPLRACFESVALGSTFLAYKRSIWDNAALPGVIISPMESISEDERLRLEHVWNQRFRKGGAGRILVADSALNVAVLQSSLADVAALAEAGASRADIANAFGVPLAFLTSETNLANLQAAEHQHASKAIQPRLMRRDEKLNEQFIPLYDPSGRLFLRSDDPVPDNLEERRAQEKQDLEMGVRTINEVRAAHGLAAVAWGDKPWLPVNWMPTDFPGREALVPGTGRGRVHETDL